MTNRVVKVSLKGDASDLLREYDKADRATDKLGREIDEIDAKLKDTFKAQPKLPVTPEIDPKSIPKKIPVPPGREPKVPTTLDPLMADFQASLRKESAALARLVNMKIPVTPETDKLRDQVKTRLLEIEKNLKMEVPTEPAARREYELALRNMVDSASQHVKAHIKTEVDPAQAAKLGTEIGTTAGKNAAGGMASGVSSGGPLLMAAITGVALGVAPSVGAAVAALITTGLGLGAIGAGVAIAFKDPRIIRASEDLKTRVTGDLSSAASGFVKPLAASMAYLELSSARLAPSLKAGFDSIAPYLGKLTTGLVGFAEKAMPGILAGIEGAKPLLDELANVLPELGDAVGDFFRIISEDSDKSASDLQSMLRLLASLIRSAAHMIAFLRDTWHGAVIFVGRTMQAIAGAAEIAFGWIPGVANMMKAFGGYWAGQLKDFENGATSAADATAEFGGAINRSAGASAAAKERTEVLTKSLEEQITAGRTLAETWRILNGGLADSDQAMLDASEQLKTIRDGWAEHGKIITGNTDAALKNRIELTNYLEITNRIYDAQIAQGKSTEEAAAATNVYIGKLRETMMQAGYTKAQIDEFILAVSKVPGEKTTQMRVEEIDAMESIDRIQTKLESIRDRNIVIRAELQQARRPTGSYDTFAENRWGGVYEPAAAGLLREAATYSTRSPGRYMIAEPQTGGEAFIPRFGDPGRSGQILAKAASWYGMSVGTGGGGDGTYVGNVNLYLGPEKIYQGLLQFRRRSGKTTLAL